MTDPNRPDTDETTPDETFTWTGDGAATGHHADAAGDGPAAAGDPDAKDPADAKGTTGAGTAGSTATAILESIRDAVDDLAERASPTVREFSARAAELAAIAADRAAPFAKRAGDVTSDASGKIATKSRIWAADIRATMAAAEHEAPTAAPDAGEPTAPDAPDAPDAHTASDATTDPSDGSTPA